MDHSPHPPPPRWKVTVAYDGTNLGGWQRQPGVTTVQSIIEDRLAHLFKEPVLTHGSGRTDAGVHARAQVFHMDAPWKHSAESLLKALNAGLSPNVRILALEPVSADFHARYSARAKRYSYHFAFKTASPFTARYCWAIFDRAFDLDLATKVLTRFRGRHNFAAFSALRIPGQTIGDPMREISRISLESPQPQHFVLTAVANGFMYKMMRSMTGALVDCAAGRINIEDIDTALATGQRTHRILTAPPHGLFLDEVIYD